MDDIQAKIEYIRKLQATGLSPEAVQEKLIEFDAMESEGQAQALSAVTNLHLQGTMQVPERDQQDNEENILAAAKVRAGTYDPERDSTVPDSMRSQAAQKTAELYESLGIPVPDLETSLKVTEQVRAKPEQNRSRLIIKGSSTTLGSPKVKK